jgi:hypothetical protein
MELGVVNPALPRPAPVNYFFGAPLADPSFGDSSPLFTMEVTFGTQRFTKGLINEVLSAIARAHQASIEALADTLEANTEHLSIVRRAAWTPTFSLLAAEGPAAVSAALHRLAGEHRPIWLLFLQRVAGERPAAGAGSIEDAVRAWRDWGEKQGLV